MKSTNLLEVLRLVSTERTATTNLIEQLDIKNVMANLNFCKVVEDSR